MKTATHNGGTGMSKADLLRAYDNGGKTLDRYTVLRTDWSYSNDGQLVECIGMSDNPTHPQGFGQHGAAMPGRHLGLRVPFDSLPVACQQVAAHFTEGI